MHNVNVLVKGKDRCTLQVHPDDAQRLGLDAPVDVLAERTARRNTRPLLRTPDLKGTLERLSAERRPSYEEAHIHVRSGDGAHRDVVEAIVQALKIT